MFFENWYGLLRVAVVAPLAYLGLIVLLRASGKRTLAKLNAFDLIVTVALGSTLASIITSKSIPLIEGLTALLVLILLQYVVAWLSVRSERVSQLVKSEPTLLLRDGRFLPEALKKQRVTSDEVLAALRSSGVDNPNGAAAVILETDGSLSVIKAGLPLSSPVAISVP